MRDLQLPGDKRERIVGAALECFARNGYKKAAMEEVAARAGISKGLIFHYFGSKKKLYLFLYEFAYGLVYEKITGGFGTAPPDLFERVRWAQQRKLELLGQYPYVLDFLAAAHREMQLTAQTEALKGESFPDWTPAFLEGIGTAKLRPGLEPEKAVKIILWCTDGVLAEHREHFVLEDIFTEMDGYLEMLRPAFYKEETL